MTSRITHAKPQVFYETFPVMKTFLWGFIFFFPSSSPPLLLLLFPVGRWPAQGAAVMLSLRAGWSAVPELGCSRDEGIGGSRPLGWSPFSGDCTGAVQGPNCYVNPGSCHDRAQALVPHPGVGRGAFAQTPQGGTGAASPSEPPEHWASLSKGPVVAGPALLQGHINPGGAVGSSQSFPEVRRSDPLCSRSSCAEITFSKAMGVLQRNLLSLEGPAESNSRLREFAGKWPSTADI